MKFETYFSFDSILDALIKKRVRIIEKNRSSQFLNSIARLNNSKLPRRTCNYEYIERYWLCKIFPSRSNWINSKPEFRKRLKDITKISQQELRLSVKDAIKGREKDGTEPEWLKLLCWQIEQVKRGFNDPNYEISAPVSVSFVLKDKNKVPNEYRATSIYQLTDSIILSLLNKYLTDQIDYTGSRANLKYFSDSSYAYRCKYIKDVKGKNFNHQSAFGRIIDYWKTNKEKEIYVAELDLKKFFDTISHDTIKERIVEIEKVFSDIGRPIHSTAIRLCYSYLNSYCFQNNILVRGKGDKDLYWPKTELIKLGIDVENEKLGIAQGGALSGFFSNLVLNELDKIFPDDSQLLYLRYCDDLIILHTNKTKNEQYFNEAIQKLDSLKLPINEPAQVKQMDYFTFTEKNSKRTNCFWSLKSKRTYKWAQYFASTFEEKSNVPWISFVGYQLRYDGLMRIRKNSIKKQIEKQKRIVSDVVKLMTQVTKLGGSIKVDLNKIGAKVQGKLIAMAVGKKNRDNSRSNLSWVRGFELAKDYNNFLFSQVKNLDRQRTKSLKHLERFLNSKKIQKLKPTDNPVKIISKYKSSYYASFNTPPRSPGIK